jgi:peroxiredoxin
MGFFIKQCTAGFRLAAVWLALGLAACALQSASDTPQHKRLVEQPAPPFTVQSLDGETISLARYRGKTILVNFWATWCGACKLEMPWLAQLREQYAKQGFEVLGIVTDGASDEKVKQIAEKYGVKYPILRCNHKTAQAYGGLAYLPSSFYINRNGTIILEAADASSKADIEADIRKTLQSGAR